MAGIDQEAINIIRGKMSRYCRYADLQEFDTFDEIALPDAKFSFVYPDGSYMYASLEGQTGDEPYKFDSLAEFQAFFKKTLPATQTSHLVDSGDFVKVSDDEIKVTFSGVFAGCPKGEVKGAGYGNGGGYYYETWKKVDGDWFMSDMKWLMLVQRQF